MFISKPLFVSIAHQQFALIVEPMSENTPISTVIPVKMTESLKM